MIVYYREKLPAVQGVQSPSSCNFVALENVPMGHFVGSVLFSGQ